MSWDSYPRYVSAGDRAARAARELAKRVKAGEEIEPLGELTHRTKIATSFWGRAWCRHIEQFSDYEYRLPRGRSYVRAGAVLHLAIRPGEVKALVSGTEVYELSIQVRTLQPTKWQRIRKRCQGRIGSLIELLQGKISDEVMEIVTDIDDGLFPMPGEIRFNCSCPDWADLCKHSAAVLYGVAARLDSQPGLLFTLRGVDHNELIVGAGDAGVPSGCGRRKRIDDASLAGVFGIEFEPVPAEEPPPRKAVKKKPSQPAARTRKKSKPAKSRKK